MAVKVSPSAFSCLATSLSRRGSQLSLSTRRSYKLPWIDTWKHRSPKVNLCQLVGNLLHSKANPSRRQAADFFALEDETQESEFTPDVSEEDEHHQDSEVNKKSSSLSLHNHPYKTENRVNETVAKKIYHCLLWLIGSVVLVTSFVFPTLYLRQLLITSEGDLLWSIDYRTLFLAEAFAYSGVSTFILLIEQLMKPSDSESKTNNQDPLVLKIIRRIVLLVTLMLSPLILMLAVIIALPFIGPVTLAIIAPYIVGIVVQFAFELYARYQKSPVRPVILLVFQVYRMHQLHRAAQLLTGLAFTINKPELTPYELELVKYYLAMISNVLLVLGIMGIWSFSRFIMHFFPSSSSVTTT